MTSLRSYTLRVPSTPGGEVRIERNGPANPLAIGIGQEPRQAIELAGLLFPVCPSAHRAAALNAMEAALQLRPTAEQFRARQVLTLAEALSASAFRVLISWPKLLAQPPQAELVREVRTTLYSITRSLSTLSWSPSDRLLSPRAFTAEGKALRSVHTVLTKTIDNGQRYLDDLELEAKDLPVASLPPLGESIFDPLTTPQSARRVETAVDDQMPRTVFEVLRTHLDMISSLREAFEYACAETEVHEAQAPIAGTTNRGIGIAQTARGRLRHRVEIEEDRITSWHADAPTDWNLAPGGPLASAVAALPRDRSLERRVSLLIAAYDPCAPCEFILQREIAHA